MQLFSGQIRTIRAKSVSPRVRLLSRITLQAVLLAAAVAVGLACYSSRSGGVLMPNNELEPGTLDVAGLPSAGQAGIEGQLLRRDNKDRLKINVDVFNAHRKSILARDSEELLSLAVALKAELNRNPGEPPSADAVHKAQEIEKLAHKVKDQMEFNPSLGPL